ncbi:DUF2652 domain-containing protein [Reichenbachiella versicolor]|uniref:DUF2652 domain-containing protein n=1 Tax=Reichenbachiella versicolor TaxID=1821036 RepID=UPI000D6E8F8C|nr:DUF2652 domain-containing protein [Reichenbachiella versicolor]
MKDTTLFFPDISGFTRFVKDSSPEHSAHITHELINVILEANQFDLRVAEIEGDAVFFFKEGIMSLEDIREQSRLMFLAFHNHIKKYESRRICNCGACVGAIDLKLKFIVHQGPTVIQEFAGGISKPHGKDVVVAHRLLKNKIGLDEYILFSDDFLGDEMLTNEMCSGALNDDQLGQLGFQYELISDWHADVKDEFIDMVGPNESERVLERFIKINADIDVVFKFILNLNLREAWNKSAYKIEFNKNEINRIGTEHNCIVDGESLKFETVSKESDGFDYIYGEKLIEGAPFEDFATYFMLKRGENGVTILKSEVYLKPKNFFQRMMLSFIKAKIIKGIKDALDNLKKISEQKNISSAA